jgi:predicted nucleic acid-binding protein
MKAFWDSNAILAYLLAGGSDDRFAAVPATAEAIVNDLIAGECFRAAWHESRLEPVRSRLPFALAQDFDRVTPDWPLWLAAFEPLARRYAPRVNAGTNDLLHLASAEMSGCDALVSLDVASGLRALAHVRGLRVFPAIDSLPAKDAPLIKALR